MLLEMKLVLFQCQFFTQAKLQFKYRIKLRYVFGTKLEVSKECKDYSTARAYTNYRCSFLMIYIGIILTRQPKKSSVALSRYFYT